MRWNMYKIWCDLFDIDFQVRVLKKTNKNEIANKYTLLDSIRTKSKQH